MSYNGHKNWNFWNVALWIGNDEGIYNLARECKRRGRNRDASVEMFINTMAECGSIKTPDGAPWTKSAVRAAMVDL